LFFVFEIPNVKYTNLRETQCKEGEERKRKGESERQQWINGEIVDKIKRKGER
jgi:hypothetical protein